MALGASVREPGKSASAAAAAGAGAAAGDGPDVLAALRAQLAAAQATRLVDAASGLPNREAFRDSVESLVAARQADGDGAVVLVLGMDRLNHLRESLGYAAADAVALRIAQRLRDCVPEAALLGRLGDNEFAVALASRRARIDAAVLAYRVTAAIDGPMRVGDDDVRLLGCVGIACLPEDGTRADRLLGNAHVAMHFARDHGTRPYEFFTAAIGASSRQRVRLEAELRAGLDRGEFLVYYQPRCELATGRVVGVEALLRWDHPERGLLAAGDFIDLAVDTGLITPIGEAVVRRACRDATQWPECIALSVNLSTREFRGARLETIVDSALADSGLAPGRFQLEINAAALQGRMADTDVPLVRLTALRERGVQVVLDNFGAAGGGPDLLRRCRAEFVKIDAALIREQVRDDDARAVVRSVVALAAHFGSVAIAEGVEDAQQAAEARNAGCLQAQGFHLGRPVTAGDLRDLLLAAASGPPA